jgi:hypothetical protein
MKNSWKTNTSGKLQLLLICYVTAFLIYVMFAGWTTFRYGGTFADNLGEALLITFPITLALIIVPLVSIIKKKIPNSIDLNNEERTLKISFPGGKCFETNIEATAWVLIETRIFNVLVLYEKVSGYSGHTVYKQFCSIIGPAYSFAWNKRKLNEIAERMNESGVELHEYGNNKHISDYFFD